MLSGIMPHVGLIIRGVHNECCHRSVVVDSSVHSPVYSSITLSIIDISGCAACFVGHFCFVLWCIHVSGIMSLLCSVSISESCSFAMLLGFKWSSHGVCI